MQQRVRADREIQVLGFRLHRPRYLGSNDAEQVAKFVIDRAAAVARTDRRGNLQHVIPRRARNNSIAHGKIQSFRMSDYQNLLALLLADTGSTEMGALRLPDVPPNH